MAKLTLDRFLKAWKAGNYLKMYKFSQITWKSNHSKNDLKLRFKGLNLDDYSIGHSQSASPSIFAFKVQAKINGVWKTEHEVNVICEEAFYKPSEKGVWGVNPVSATKLFN